MITDGGEFERSETTFRNWIRDEDDARFQPDDGRYHLYISRACPWAHGAGLVRRLTGLNDVLSMDVVDPNRGERGWKFSPERDGCTPDSINGFDYLAEVYRNSEPSYQGHVSVPVLWDREEGMIVNNESIEIMWMLNDAFGAHKSVDVDLAPEGYRDEIERIVDDLYDPINNGVYRAGFAGTQEAYDRAVTELFDALDHWDSVLADQRYLAGDRLTLADLRLFPTLVRFDQVYHTHFKCNRKHVHEYDNLWPYLRDLYQTPGVARSVNMDHIKEHYYRTHGSINPKGIVAVGPELDFTAPHDRDELPGAPPAALLDAPSLSD